MTMAQTSSRKVGIVGTGMVGASFAYALMQRSVATEIVLDLELSAQEQAGFAASAQTPRDKLAQVEP